jgi:hypothetical protein
MTYHAKKLQKALLNYPSLIQPPNVRNPAKTAKSTIE